MIKNYILHAPVIYFSKLIKRYFGDERGSVFCDNIDDKNSPQLSADYYY